MIDLLSERRMVENEAFFRQSNEKVQKKLDKLNSMAKSDGHHDLQFDNHDLKLHFYCECADENCRERIILKLGEYRNIHEKRDRFVLIPGHEVADIERTVNEREGYNIVEKLLNPPETPVELHETEVSNV